MHPCTFLCLWHFSSLLGSWPFGQFLKSFCTGVFIYFPSVTYFWYMSERLNATFSVSRVWLFFSIFIVYVPFSKLFKIWEIWWMVVKKKKNLGNIIKFIYKCVSKYIYTENRVILFMNWFLICRLFVWLFMIIFNITNKSYPQFHIKLFV